MRSMFCTLVRRLIALSSGKDENTRTISLKYSTVLMFTNNFLKQLYRIRGGKKKIIHHNLQLSACNFNQNERFIGKKSNEVQKPNTITHHQSNAWIFENLHFRGILGIDRNLKNLKGNKSN